MTSLRVSVEESPHLDDRQVVVGGLLGHVKWRWLYVEKLWLPESLRGQGHGSRLLAEAEAFASARGCLGVHLDTFEHQALPFYRQHGYEVFGVHEGFPPGYCQYHLKKDLATQVERKLEERRRK